jgi:RIO-like serine/threonine protein kinase
LQEIHKVGVVHNDNRCQNLLIDNRGRASIIDFDQAQKSSSAKAMEEESLQLVDLLNS